MIILVLVAATYAINILKIGMVVRDRPLAAAALEGVQGFMYLYVLVRVLESANTTVGMLAYVGGASLGTLVAVRLQRGRGINIPGHYHACCPPVGPLPLPSVVAAAAPHSGDVQRRIPADPPLVRHDAEHRSPRVA